MKKRSMLFITTLTVLILMGLQLLMSHRLSTEGFNVTEMTLQTQLLERENEILSHKIASSSSYMTVSRRAKELGFADAFVRRLERPPVAMK